jgi:streptogramin lyase
MDLAAGEVRSWFIDSMPHRIAADDNGCVWGTYTDINRFFKYDPDADRMDLLDFGPPGVSADFDPANQWNAIDSVINGGDGYIYMGTVAGALCRLDPRVPEVTYLGKPVASGRMSDMLVGPDGLLYLGAGALHMTCIVTFDRRRGLFTNYGLIRDQAKNVTDFVVHQMTMTSDGIIYCGETDQPIRSAYLWECVLER